MRLNYLDFMVPSMIQAIKASGSGSDSLQTSLVSPDNSNSFNAALSTALHDKDREKLKESCQQMEAVFIGKIMEGMRATIQHSDLIERGFAEETFESMLWDKYAGNMSKTGQLGLADILYKQLEPALED